MAKPTPAQQAEFKKYRELKKEQHTAHWNNDRDKVRELQPEIDRLSKTFSADGPIVGEGGRTA